MKSGTVKKTLQLDGLTCTSCEARIKNRLKEIEGIDEVEVSFVTQILTVTYEENKINLEDISSIIEELDYVVKRDAVMVKSEDVKKTNSQLIIFVILLLGLYVIIKNTVGFNFIPEISPNMGYAVLFTVGLLSSLHCVAMCGGINLSLCVSYKFEKEKNGVFSKLAPSLMYNMGRVISYTIVGGIVGAVGSVFRISNKGSAFISIAAGVFMVIMGLNMLQIFPWLRKINPHMPAIFADKIHSQKKNKGPFVVGLLNGFMPCGPLQAMQLYALGTGSFITGALSMLMFSLGTVPLLFTFGALGSMLSSRFTKKMVKASAVLVVVLGILMMNRGLAFTGVSLNTDIAYASNRNDNTNTAIVNKDIQEIKTTLSSGRYTPITVQTGIPVKWTIQADADSLNGCNNEIIIPEYGIRQKLVAGENEISFTPTDTGRYGYSCWMGMIRSSITVLDNIQDIDTKEQEETSAPVDNSGLPAGCCGYNL